MRPHCPKALRRAVALMVVSIGSSVAAQTSGSVSIVSDYRFRGVSLSNGHPEPQVNLGYDSQRGWYVGAFASGVQLEDEKGNNTQLLLYGGYARPPQSGFGWEFGAVQSVFLRAGGPDYTEVFAGISSDSVSGRIYFSPDYFGEHARTLYAEVNSSYRLHDRLRLLGHVGLHHFVSGLRDYAPRPANRFDLRIGASAGLGDWNVELAWITTNKKHGNSSLYERLNRTWVLNASYSF